MEIEYQHNLIFNSALNITHVQDICSTTFKHKAMKLEENQIIIIVY